MGRRLVSMYRASKMNPYGISVAHTVITLPTMAEMFGRNEDRTRFLHVILFVSLRKHQVRKHPNFESKVVKIMRQDCERSVTTSVLSSDQQTVNLGGKQEDDENVSEDEEENGADLKHEIPKANMNFMEQRDAKGKGKPVKNAEVNLIQHHPSTLPLISNFAPVRVFQCSSCHQQGTYKWVVERHIRAKHPDQPDAHVIELPAELAVKLQKISPPLKRFRCSLCPLQSKHTWVIIRVRTSRLIHALFILQWVTVAFFASTSNIFIHYKQHPCWTSNPMEHQSMMNRSSFTMVRIERFLLFVFLPSIGSGNHKHTHHSTAQTELFVCSVQFTF